MLPDITAKISFYYILNCFFVYSFLGWVFESIVMTFENKAITNRGFIRGPFCTIYGVGALSAYYFLQPISDHPFAVFMLGMILATLIEMITAKLMTYLFGEFWWNYEKKPFNYKGVICLESSLCWGAMCLGVFFIFQPLVEGIVDYYYTDYGRGVALWLSFIFVVDFTTSFYKARRANKNPRKNRNIREIFDIFDLMD